MSSDNDNRPDAVNSLITETPQEVSPKLEQQVIDEEVRREAETVVEGDSAEDREAAAEEILSMFGWRTVFFLFIMGGIFLLSVLMYKGYFDLNVFNSTSALNQQPELRIERIEHMEEAKFSSLSAMPEEAKRRRTPKDQLLGDPKIKVDNAKLSPAERTAMQTVKTCKHLRLEQALKLGVSPNLVDEKGETLLTWASRLGCLRGVKVLIDAGAAVERPNRRGQTPLYIAQRAGKIDVAKLLVKSGATQ